MIINIDANPDNRDWVKQTKKQRSEKPKKAVDIDKLESSQIPIMEDTSNAVSQ